MINIADFRVAPRSRALRIDVPCSLQVISSFYVILHPKAIHCAAIWKRGIMRDGYLVLTRGVKDDTDDRS